jgi:DNA-binding NarL/FixJ family response regulator
MVSLGTAAAPADMGLTASTPLRLLLVTRREALGALFRAPGRVEVEVSSPDAGPAEQLLASADVVAVDVALEPDAATALCHDLHALRPELPIVAVLCCPQSMNPWQLQTLLGGGVDSVVDLQASLEEAVRTVEAAARGGSVLHLHLRRGHRRFLREVLVGNDARRELKVRILECIARGLSDREIGAALHLSPHTVKHHVEDLRDEVDARNRTELAGWAGRHGFYRPENDDVVPVQLARTGRP